MINIPKISGNNNSALTLFVVSIFLTLSLVGIIHHEMWRDELQAWMIARDSSSLIELFTNLRYEGHPGLWHLCLYFITRFTRNPQAMQFFHLLIATIVIYIFIQLSPFTRWQKLLFAFGYFPFYEYSIISRNYSLGILLLFTFCNLFPIRQQSYLPLAIIIALMMNTNVYMLMIAVSLILALVVDWIMYQQRTDKFNHNKWDILFSIFILIITTVIVVTQLLPPADSDFKGENEQILTPSNPVEHNIRRFTSKVLVTIWKSYIPLPQFSEYFWNTNIIDNSSVIIKAGAIIISIIFILLAVLLFIRKPVALCLYVTGTVSILLFSQLKFIGAIRHFGHMFILFLACVWISNCYENDLSFVSNRFKKLAFLISRYRNKFLLTLLFVHAVAGLYAFSMDLINPFSMSQKVANFIEIQRLNNLQIVGSKDFIVSPVVAFLDRKIYYPESGKVGSFIVWSQRREIEHPEVMQAVNQLLATKIEPILLVLDEPLNLHSENIIVTNLANFSQGIVYDEEYYLYIVRRKSPVSQKVNLILPG